MDIYREQYPVANVDITNWKITMLYCSWVNQDFLFSMAIFNSYVCLPEGIQMLKTTTVDLLCRHRHIIRFDTDTLWL